MKKALFTGILMVFVWGEIVDCNALFQSRKEEIAGELQKLQEQQQMLQILQGATEGVLKEREAKLKAQEDEIKKKQEAFEQEEKDFQAKLKTQEEQSKKRLEEQEKKIKDLIAQNQALLEEIKGVKQDKVVQTYTKMKDSKAALILESLPAKDAVDILGKMDAKLMSRIMAKMTPQKAGEITTMLQEVPSQNTDLNPQPQAQ
ncbi:MotE family protein [Helicobacter cholecystus]|uniref:MotE family protein n=1 Tax=Helicobacter cholecystus TaxID=45498 RepID=UPI002739CD00|nr:flagellar protein FlbB [Helicobacter cholecystus]